MYNLRHGHVCKSLNPFQVHCMNTLPIKIFDCLNAFFKTIWLIMVEVCMC